MAKNRYPGVKPFSSEESEIFFGREQDVKNLFKMVMLEKSVLLYAKSGLGKSSLLNAGLIPMLRETTDYRVVSVRFGAFTPLDDDYPVATTIKSIVQGMRRSRLLDKLIPQENSLWYHLKSLQLFEAEQARLVLVFDQFEELFTYPDESITVFKQQLSEVLYAKLPAKFREKLEQEWEAGREPLDEQEMERLHQPLDVKVVFSIRSDRLAELNQVSDQLHDIQQRYYELLSLSIPQAKEAIVKPASLRQADFATPHFRFDNSSLEKIFNYLTKNGREKIESFQLQVVCRHIESHVLDSQLAEVWASDIGDLEPVIKNFYNDTLRLFSDEDRGKVQTLLEEHMVLPEERRRVSLLKGHIVRRLGVSDYLLSRLVDTHLLRVEPKPNGDLYYELSHDSLVDPILEARAKRDEDKRKENELREALRLQADEKLKLRKSRRRFLTYLFFSIMVFGALSLFIRYQYKINGELELANQTANEQSALALEKEAEAMKLLELLNREREINDSIFISLGMVFGSVTDVNGRPIDGARIILGDQTRLTNSQGMFLIMMPTTPQKLYVEKENFRRAKVPFNPREFFRLDVVLVELTEGQLGNTLLKEAREYERRDMPDSALVKIEQAAALNIAQAWLQRGVYLRDGSSSRGVRLPEAQASFERAAELGSNVAKYELAKLLVKNQRSVEVVPAQALLLLEDAARAGVVGAQVEYGNVFFQRDDHASRVEAVKWYRRAANSGDPYAQLNLGTAFRYGYGITKNLDSARYWYNLCALDRAKQMLREMEAER